MDHFVSVLPTVLACAAALFAGGLVKGVISLGLPMVALPVMMTVVDVRVAVAMLLVPVFLSNLIQGLQGEGTVALTKRFAALLVMLSIGTLIGTALFAMLSKTTLLLVIGPLTIVLATASLLQPDLAIPPRAEKWLGPPVGLASGVIGGMSTFFGPLLTIYVVGLHLPRDTFVKAIGLLYIVAAGFMLVGAAAHGTTGPLLLALSLLGMLPVYLGMAIGQRIRHRIDPKLFRLLVLGVIWITGANMIRQGLGF
jgi:uncharacterized membrane protein YfcA